MAITYWVREDSGSANNPALNLTGANSIEITFIAETSVGGAGDFELDQPGGGAVDPDTQVSIGGANYEFTYELTGTMPTTNSDSAQQVPDQFEGTDVIIITVQDYPSAGETTRLAFMPNESATQVEMDSFGNGAIDIQSVNTTPSATPICFVRGTLIETMRGPVLIEMLEVGDQIKTMDAGFASIRWIGSMVVPAIGNAAPIRFRVGALGNTRDLWVSPQHRMLLQGWQMELLFEQNEVLATAKSLINDHSICRVEGGDVEYYHILFDSHQIIFAEGTPCESFHPGVQALDTLGDATRQEVLTLFPELSLGTDWDKQTARLCLKSYESKVAAFALAI
jgi:hypothetical protein